VVVGDRPPWRLWDPTGPADRGPGRPVARTQEEEPAEPFDPAAPVEPFGLVDAPESFDPAELPEPPEDGPVEAGADDVDDDESEEPAPDEPSDEPSVDADPLSDFAAGTVDSAGFDDEPPERLSVL